jgi:hypothetical protein
MQVGFELLRQEPNSRKECLRWAGRFAKVDRANSDAIQLELVSGPPSHPPPPSPSPLTSPSTSPGG